MPTVILLRHGRTTANTGGVLAGWTPGVQLDETGLTQVQAVGERLAKVPLATVGISLMRFSTSAPLSSQPSSKKTCPLR